MFQKLLIGCILLASAQVASAVDLFDRHTSYWLKKVGADVQPAESLSSGQAARLKNLGPGIDLPCVVIKTNNGNWAKALVTWGFHKSKDGKPVPVVLIDRYVTYHGERGDQAVAAGKNVMLFEGFGFNFDLGQVVPAGHGPDITCSKRLLAPVGEAKLFPVDGSALPATDDPEKGDPLDHEGVLPRDFTGTWQINGDGRWRGQWEIKADADGRVQGKFISDETKSAYPLQGRVRGLPHRLNLQVFLANSTQELELYMWTTDKMTMAGTMTVQERTFGIYAKRVAEKAEEKKEAE